MASDEHADARAMLIRLARMQQELKGRMNDSKAEAYASRSQGRRHGLLAKVNALGNVRSQLEYILRRHKHLLIHHFGTDNLVEIAGNEINTTTTSPHTAKHMPTP